MAGCFTFPNACKSRRMRLTILIAQEKVFPAVVPADHRADGTGILVSRDPQHPVKLAPLAHGLKKNMRGASPSAVGGACVRRSAGLWPAFTMPTGSTLWFQRERFLGSTS